MKKESSWYQNIGSKSEEEVDDRSVSFADCGATVTTLPNHLFFISDCKNYVIDFDKVTNIEDIVTILKHLNIQFSFAVNVDEIPEDLNPYLKESE